MSTVPITRTGEFDLQLYSYQTSLPRPTVEQTLSRLLGPNRFWTVELYDPDDENPHGRLSIQHSVYNDCTEVVLSSTYGRNTITYTVQQTGTGDTFSTVEDVGTALTTAVETANRELFQQAWFLPQYDTLPFR